MARTRVLLHNLPKLLVDVGVEPFRKRDGIRVVGRVGSPLELAAAVREHQPDVLVVGTADAEPPPNVVDLIAARPTLKVLCVRKDCSSANVFEVWLHRVSIGDLSPADLPRAIQTIASDSRPLASSVRFDTPKRRKRSR